MKSKSKSQTRLPAPAQAAPSPAPRPNVARTTAQRQQALIHACTHEDRTLNLVMAELNIDPPTLARWLRTRTFRQKLGAIRKTYAESTKLHMQKAALGAGVRLSEISNRELKRRRPSAAELREIRSACVDLLRLARERRKPRPTDPSLDATRSLYHPGLSHDEARTLEQELGGR